MNNTQIPIEILEGYGTGLIKKVVDDFNGHHPNGIGEGYKRIGVCNLKHLKVDENFYVGSLVTSPITEIVLFEEINDLVSKFIFKTLNSTYLLYFYNGSGPNDQLVLNIIDFLNDDKQKVLLVPYIPMNEISEAFKITNLTNETLILEDVNGWQMDFGQEFDSEKGKLYFEGSIYYGDYLLKVIEEN